MSKLLVKLMTAVALFSCFVSCKKSEYTQTHHVSFYHWKSTYGVDEEVREKLQNLDCKTVYLHYFDVVKKNGVVMPVDEVKPIYNNVLAPDSVVFVPVVFIANEVFKDMTEEAIVELAGNMDRLIRHISWAGARYSEYEEIQIDCDWTQTTKDAYFRFLQVLGETTQKMITSTIRLHQVKDKEVMGVPPVSKGYLMCYATSDPRDGMDSNSILDLKLLKNYTQNMNEYPLPLDMALPLFSWGIVTNNEGKVKLVNGLCRKDMENDGFESLGKNKYKVKDDCFLNGLFVDKGFTIEVEEITPDLLKESICYLDETIGHEYNIVYYHLSKGFLDRFSVEYLK